MLKAFWKFLSDVCWTARAENWAMRFLLMSLETTNVTAPTIDISNSPPITVPKGPFNPQVVYEDQELLERLGAQAAAEVPYPVDVLDIN